MILFVELAFIGTVCYAIYLMMRYRIPLASSFSVYLFFTVLYILFPLLVMHGYAPTAWYIEYSLSSSIDIVLLHTFIGSASLLIFCSCYTRFNKNPFKSSPKIFAQKKSFVVFLIPLIFILIAIYVGSQTVYTSEKSSLENAGSSNIKAIAVGAYVGYLAIYGMSKKTTMLIVLLTILLFVEGSRWYVTSAYLATLIYLVRVHSISSTSVSILLLILLCVFSWIGVTRVGQDFDVLLFANPFFIEGTYGSYMHLQVLQLIVREKLNWFTVFSDYLIDPIIYLVPRVISESIGYNKDDFGIFAYFISVHQKYLSETYAPVGGFYYLAQATSAFPFIGPILVTYLFGRVSRSIDVIDFHVIKARFFSLVIVSGFLFVFIKTIFAQTIKYGLTFSLGAILVYVVSRYFNRAAFNCK